MPREREPRAKFLQLFVHWAPVWVPMLLLGQIGIRVFLPARLESQRLHREEERLKARCERAQATYDEYRTLSRAQSDPIYLEREIKMLETPGQ